MPEPEEIKRIVPRVTDQEAQALADWYAALANAVREFPASDLKDVEPPLRSVAGPPRP